MSVRPCAADTSCLSRNRHLYVSSDLAEPWVAFIFPSLMHTIAFRREADRKAATLKPFK